MSNEVFKPTSLEQSPNQSPDQEQNQVSYDIQGSILAQTKDVFSADFWNEDFDLLTPSNPTVREKIDENDLSPDVRNTPYSIHTYDQAHDLSPTFDWDRFDTQVQTADTIPAQPVPSSPQGAGIGPNNSPGQYGRQPGDRSLTNLWEEADTRLCTAPAPAQPPTKKPLPKDFYTRSYTGEND